MGRRGPAPDYAKRERLAQLLADGVSLSEAARQVGVNRKTAKRWRNGRSIRYPDGRVLKLPPVITTTTPRSYSTRYLSEDERIRLADLRRAKHTVREIGRLMGRSASTISRELRRGADAGGRYHPFDAHRRALARRRIHRPSRLATDPVLREWVAGRLTARWSPETIAVALRRQFPDQPGRWLCAETIYQAVYRPDLGGLPRELPGRVLRRRRRHRVRRREAQRRRVGPVTGMTMIHDRDEAVWDRSEVGHWEGDLIMGAGNATAIVTLAERTTRYTLLGHLPAGAHDAATVTASVVAALALVPAAARRTLTWDQGKEMAKHAQIADQLGIKVYFCDAHSPWQRPTNENTNGVLRDYFPKGSDLSVHSAADLAAVQAELNDRPRKVLDWDTPAECLAKLLATPVLRH